MYTDYFSSWVSFECTFFLLTSPLLFWRSFTCTWCFFSFNILCNSTVRFLLFCWSVIIIHYCSSDTEREKKNISNMSIESKLKLWKLQIKVFFYQCAKVTLNLRLKYISNLNKQRFFFYHVLFLIITNPLLDIVKICLIAHSSHVNMGFNILLVHLYQTI